LASPIRIKYSDPSRGVWAQRAKLKNDESGDSPDP